MKRAAYLLLAGALLVTTPVLAQADFAQAGGKLQDLVASAKPGQTVQLPPGELVGPATLSEGVTLKGAGYDKTVINAAGCDNGIIIKGSNCVLSDLTIRGASGANLLVQGADRVTVQRIRATGGLVGVSVTDSKACRIENVIADANRYGIVLAGGESNAAVNCTIAGNGSLGLSLAAGKNHVAFNNVVTDSLTAVAIGQDAVDVTLDYNLYAGFNIGKFRGQLPRNTLNNWRFLSGQDAHSLNVAVKYEDAANGKFKAVSVLDWALDRPVVSGWGAPALKGHDAPTQDIDGAKRPAASSLGAIECTAQAARPADGTFDVPPGEGLVSAGVFDSNGMLVSYLFQSLPLTEGKHSFWLPSRTYKGRNIEAGQYEVRLVKAKMDWKYMGWIANTEKSTQPGTSASFEKNALAFDNDGRLMVGNHLSEEHMAVRGYDGATGKSLWWFNGDYADALTMASDGLLYVLRPVQARLSRLRTVDGDIAPWGEKDFGHFGLDCATYTGIASLGQELFYADTSNNALRVGTLDSPTPTRSIEVKAPGCPSADAKTNVIWVISGGHFSTDNRATIVGGDEIIALDREGKIIARSTEVPEPIALAARDGRLAVASRKTGKVHILDASNPAQLKQLSTVGRGDGPDGMIMPDRFLFQDGAMGTTLALGPKGELAIGEFEGRIIVFDRDGKLLWFSFAIWGGGSIPSSADPGRVFYGPYSMLLDGEKGTWQLESFNRGIPGAGYAGDFKINGQTYQLFQIAKVGMNFVKYSPEKREVVCGIICTDPAKEPWTYRVDDNKDGRVDEKDKVVSTFTDAQGKPVVGKNLMAGANAKGELIDRSEGWITIWPCAGVDEQGAPIYRYQDRRTIPSDKADIVNPYNYSSDIYGHTIILPRDDGGLVTCSIFHSSPAVRHILAPGGGEMMGVNKEGVVDWVHPFGTYADTPKIGAVHKAEDFYVCALTYTYDCIILNADGLAMPGVSPPEVANYLGHWVDSPYNMTAFTDAQGKANILTCDYMWARNHWFRLKSRDVKTAKSAFAVSAQTAASLAALPVKPLDITASKPPVTDLRIPRLKEPLKIDGDMQKWRDLGIAPIIITPEAASGIDSSRDCSAVVRLAYHGKDLYLQVIRFDDILTLHQPQGRAYQGETVEMCLNGMMDGSKFNISLTTDLGAVNKLDGWYPPHRLLTQEESPLVIKVLDNARTVAERKLIESISGQDMSDCKVQVFETRIPLDEKTFAGREKYKTELIPGKPFYIGFLIDDNDKPGTDMQNMMAWPATYGTFSPKEGGAVATPEP